MVLPTSSIRFGGRWVWASFHPGGRPLTNEELKRESAKLLKQVRVLYL